MNILEAIANDPSVSPAFATAIRPTKAQTAAYYTLQAALADHERAELKRERKTRTTGSACSAMHSNARTTSPMRNGDGENERHRSRPRRSLPHRNRLVIAMQDFLDELRATPWSERIMWVIALVLLALTFTGAAHS